MSTAAIRLELPAVPDSVREARHALAGLASRLGCDEAAVKTAVSEVVGNCVVHAYVGRDPGPVVVLARYLRGRFVVTVADRGRGMVPRVDSPGLGLGLPLVSSMAHDVRIDSDNAGAAVSMSFECELPAGDEPSPDSANVAADLGSEIERARGLSRRVLPLTGANRARSGGKRRATSLGPDEVCEARADLCPRVRLHRISARSASHPLAYGAAVDRLD